jgi:2-dehydropantoate 2-reductase
MLQDMEAGKPLEIDAMLTAVREICTLCGNPDSVHRRSAGPEPSERRVRGLYPGAAM